MNTSLLPRLLLCAAAALTSISVGAQNSLQFESESALAVVTTTHRPVTSSSSTASAPAYRFQKRLSQTYSGFAIEVVSSELPLKRDNPIFRQFGNVFYEKLLEGGYSYLIQLNFSSKEAALRFLNTAIVARAKDAKLFEYKEGARKIVN